MATQTPRFHPLDRIDCAILSALQTNGRESFADLGKGVALSATSVAERVRRLEQAGVIEGYRIQLSLSKLGSPVMAFILARPNGPDARFIAAARACSEILECHRITGNFSFIARAAVRDVKHLEKLLDRLESLAQHIVTLLVLSTSFEAIPFTLAEAE